MLYRNALRMTLEETGSDFADKVGNKFQRMYPRFEVKRFTYTVAKTGSSCAQHVQEKCHSAGDVAVVLSLYTIP